MAEYKVIVSLSTDSLIDFSKKLTKTLHEIGYNETVKISADIPMAKLVISKEISNDVQNKIERYLSKKFKEMKVKGLKVLKIKLKLKEKEESESKG